VVDPQTVHQAKFSMGTVLALIALRGAAGVGEFEAHWHDRDVVAWRDKVAMTLDEEVDRAYPARWIGKVSVQLRDGRLLRSRVDEPKGDPGNTLTREEIEAKALRLARFSGAASDAEVQAAIAAAWHLAEMPKVGTILR
jgi:2-methylcitrate dehydratase PrpD